MFFVIKYKKYLILAIFNQTLDIRWVQNVIDFFFADSGSNYTFYDNL